MGFETFESVQLWCRVYGFGLAGLGELRMKEWVLVVVPI